MQITTYSNFRRQLKAYTDQVFESKAPLRISRKNGQDMVLLSSKEYHGMRETLKLLGSPKNAQRLAESIKELNKGDG